MLRRRRSKPAPPTSTPRGWTFICLFLPPAIFFTSAILQRFNLGLRHVLPVYPFLYVGVGCAAAAAWRAHRRATLIACVALFAVLAFETLTGFPNYIAFFNAAAGGSRGGLRLLGDSNLDWGQDAPALVQWQKEHPSEQLYLGWFGADDPMYWGLKCHHLPGAFSSIKEEIPPPGEPCVMAVSATHVQEIYVSAKDKPFYDVFKKLKPFEVLNGTIYLYHHPPRPEDLVTTPNALPNSE
jgi:hypothetical protein